MAKKSVPVEYSDVRPWVRHAVDEENSRPPKLMWRGEPTAEEMIEARLRLVGFFQKYGKRDPLANIVAKRLKSCGQGQRCLCGACPECGRLLQRWFVRKSKGFISIYLATRGDELIAINIVPPEPIVGPGKLDTFSIVDLHRRIKYALEKAGIGLAIGGVDFSFNEDRKGKYDPFWCPHLYIITTIGNKNRVGNYCEKYSKLMNWCRDQSEYPLLKINPSDVPML